MASILFVTFAKSLTLSADLVSSAKSGQDADANVRLWQTAGKCVQTPYAYIRMRKMLQIEHY
jgi:hypothetical protein